MIVWTDNKKIDIYKSVIATWKDIVCSNDYVTFDDIRREINKEYGAELITVEMMKQIHRELVIAYIMRKNNGDKTK